MSEGPWCFRKPDPSRGLSAVGTLWLLVFALALLVGGTLTLYWYA